MSLTEDDVIQILKFMDQSQFEELHLNIGDLKLMVSKSGKAARSMRSRRWDWRTARFYRLALVG